VAAAAPPRWGHSESTRSRAGAEEIGHPVIGLKIRVIFVRRVFLLGRETIAVGGSLVRFLPRSSHRFDPAERGNVKMHPRPFAIVMLPPSEEGHGVALVGLKSDGSIDSGHNFLFTHRPTRGAQKSYATELANMLGCKVVEISE
jgi:hypothetical protein